MFHSSKFTYKKHIKIFYIKHIIMATFKSLKMKIERIKMEIEYLEWMLDHEEFDCDTIQYIFINLKKPDIDKIIEDKRKIRCKGSESWV